MTIPTNKAIINMLKAKNERIPSPTKIQIIIDALVVKGIFWFGPGYLNEYIYLVFKKKFGNMRHD